MAIKAGIEGGVKKLGYEIVELDVNGNAVEKKRSRACAQDLLVSIVRVVVVFMGFNIAFGNRKASQ